MYGIPCRIYHDGKGCDLKYWSTLKPCWHAHSINLARYFCKSSSTKSSHGGLHSDSSLLGKSGGHQSLCVFAYPRSRNLAKSLHRRGVRVQARSFRSSWCACKSVFLDVLIHLGSQRDAHQRGQLELGFFILVWKNISILKFFLLSALPYVWWCCVNTRCSKLWPPYPSHHPNANADEEEEEHRTKCHAMPTIVVLWSSWAAVGAIWATCNHWRMRTCTTSARKCQLRHV